MELSCVPWIDRPSSGIELSWSAWGEMLLSWIEDSCTVPSGLAASETPIDANACTAAESELASLSPSAAQLNPADAKYEHQLDAPAGRSIELSWIELSCAPCVVIELSWIELNWIELSWIELNWIELNCTPASAEPERLMLLSCTGARSIELSCTPRILRSSRVALPIFALVRPTAA